MNTIIVILIIVGSFVYGIWHTADWSRAGVTVYETTFISPVATPTPSAAQCLGEAAPKWCSQRAPTRSTPPLSGPVPTRVFLVR